MNITVSGTVDQIIAFAEMLKLARNAERSHLTAAERDALALGNLDISFIARNAAN